MYAHPDCDTSFEDLKSGDEESDKDLLENLENGNYVDYVKGVKIVYLERIK